MPLILKHLSHQSLTSIQLELVEGLNTGMHATTYLDAVASHNSITNALLILEQQ